MKKYSIIWVLIAITLCISSCSKGGKDTPPPTPAFNYVKSTIDGSVVNNGSTAITQLNPTIKFVFSVPVKQSTLKEGISFKENGTQNIACNISLQDSVTIIINPEKALKALTKYTISTTGVLSSEAGKKLTYTVSINLNTNIDPADKFPRISDNALLDLVQKQTFKYIWDFAHPVSGLVREGSQHGSDITTTGGTGFGMMGIIVGIERGFITREQGLTRMTTITKFLDEKATKYHGAFAHWINGTTGATQPFSPNDNGADLVETSLLMQGLLTARQYFNNPLNEETELRTRINKLWDNVEWDWFRQGGQNVLYWHWSSENQWIMNLKIQGWNECLITYVLAASSTTHTIPKEVYTEGWTKNGNFKNGNTYNGVKLPVGSAMGGPLFFAHYSFMGLDPRELTDDNGINYWEQNKAHSQINNKYCIANPYQFFGYSANCWGLTASTGDKGYSAHSPTNDRGVIAPTAALSSFPYTPEESKKALEFFYYKLGDNIWKDYGFIDAFNLGEHWYSPAFLAIDQAPIIVMMENHRTGLIWDLFMSATEVKDGLRKLGFQSPKI